MSVRLLVLVGPTACGKTRLAVEVAHALGSEIVSADSRQVYRGLDIGSGKDLDEYRAVTPPVPYHLHWSTARPRSVWDYKHTWCMSVVRFLQGNFIKSLSLIVDHSVDHSIYLIYLN